MYVCVLSLFLLGSLCGLKEEFGMQAPPPKQVSKLLIAIGLNLTGLTEWWTEHPVIARLVHAVGDEAILR